MKQKLLLFVGIALVIGGIYYQQKFSGAGVPSTETNRLIDQLIFRSAQADNVTHERVECLEVYRREETPEKIYFDLRRSGAEGCTQPGSKALVSQGDFDKRTLQVFFYGEG